jgi:hypothetical protein
LFGSFSEPGIMKGPFDNRNPCQEIDTTALEMRLAEYMSK